MVARKTRINQVRERRLIFRFREDLGTISKINFLSKFLATFLVSDVGKGQVSRHSSPPYLTSIVKRFLI